MQRRDFVTSMALGASLIVPLSRSAWAATTDSPTRKKLVVVMLRGAVDGLNVVAPVGDQNYRRLRPTIGLAAPGSTATRRFIQPSGVPFLPGVADSM